jgi:hypothetical protein
MRLSLNQETEIYCCFVPLILMVAMNRVPDIRDYDNIADGLHRPLDRCGFHRGTEVRPPHAGKKGVLLFLKRDLCKYLRSISDAVGDALSSKDEAEGVLKNSLLSNLIRDETGEEPSGSSTCRASQEVRYAKSHQALRLALSCTDEAEEVLKNFLLSSLYRRTLMSSSLPHGSERFIKTSKR